MGSKIKQLAAEISDELAKYVELSSKLAPTSKVLKEVQGWANHYLPLT